MSTTLLHQIFSQTAQIYPEQIAVEIPPSETCPERQQFTYREMEEMSDIWASQLAPQLDPEAIVAIGLPRSSHHLYLAQLAVLKAGGAYTCIDPSFPQERIQFILEDAQVSQILTDVEYQPIFEQATTNSSTKRHVWNVMSDMPDTTNTNDTAKTNKLPQAIPSSGLAYVIYTSGTTGKPKGVMIEHRSIVNLVQSDQAYFSLTPEDRVAQSSSAVYDSSIEEIYLAFAVGATLVVLNDEVVRLGPDLIPWLQQERISVFCPPPTLLRTTLCDNPQQALPALKLLYVGGEALSSELADRWAAGRWMENGYGPTECTVTVVRGKVEVGKPVTIGKPVVGHTALVLDQELQKVPPGAPGELCINGIGVARGYLNRPMLTQEKFVEHKQWGRIYRTGDLVQRLESGDLSYLGRIDSQVKIRGYRVELESIESHICSWDGIQDAACKVQGEGATQQLVAFFVPTKGASPDVTEIQGYLRQQLPDYMVPAHIAPIDELPMSPTSGKLDRKALPTISFALVREGEWVAANDPKEEILVEIISRRLGYTEPISTHDDFFALGGNSVLAAQVISQLRKSPETSALTVRDLYEAPTVTGLAKKLAQAERTPAPHHNANLLHSRLQALTVSDTARPLWVSTLQLLWILTVLFVGSNVGYFVGFKIFPWLLRLLGLVPFLLLSPLIGLTLFVLYLPISVGLAVAAKKLLIGTYQPGRYPVWGKFYWRNWLVQQLVGGIPWGLLGGTIFKCTLLRLLGAKIGKNVHIHNGVNITSGWDLLTLGDHVSLGRDAALRLVDLQEGHLVAGPITVGDNATLETRAGLSPFTEVQEGGFLTNLSMLPSFSTLPSGEMWDGVPACKIGQSPDAETPLLSEPSWTPQRHGVALILSRSLLGWVFALPGLLLAIGMIVYWQLTVEMALRWLFSPYQYGTFIIGLLLSILVIGLMLWLPIQALCLRWLGTIKPGTYPRWGKTHIVWWLKSQLLEGAGNTLSGTMFWPTWLRMSGMTIGPNCEISSIMEVTPELVSIGEQSFFADGIYLGTPRFHQNTFVCKHTSFGPGTFLGNHAVIPAGNQLPPDILLGIATVGKEQQVKSGTSWFGHPAFALPRREVIDCDISLTHKPSWIRWFSRFYWEFSRFFLGIFPFLLLLFWFKTLPYWWSSSTTIFFGLIVPLYTLTAMFLLCFTIFVMKWVLLGKTKPGQHPLWSCWCSRWDFLYVAWGAYARRTLAPLEGSLWLAWWLRAMGVHVGRRVVLGGGFSQVVDPDMLFFEDHATVACAFQAHSFEDRVLKMDHVHIRAGSTAGTSSILMYGADLQEGAHVGPQSVVMKHEMLLPHHYYLGCPSRSLGDIK